MRYAAFFRIWLISRYQSLLIVDIVCLLLQVQVSDTTYVTTDCMLYDATGDMLDFSIPPQFSLILPKYLLSLSHSHFTSSPTHIFPYTLCTVDDPTSKTPTIMPDGYDLSRAHTNDWLIKLYNHTSFTPSATDNFWGGQGDTRIYGLTPWHHHL